MTQTLKSLQRKAEGIKRTTKLAIYKQQVASLHETVNAQRERTRAEEARAELAERQVRQIAAERDLWKHQAQEAQAKLKSLGVRE